MNTFHSSVIKLPENKVVYLNLQILNLEIRRTQMKSFMKLQFGYRTLVIQSYFSNSMNHVHESALRIIIMTTVQDLKTVG